MNIKTDETQEILADGTHHMSEAEIMILSHFQLSKPLEAEIMLVTSASINLNLICIKVQPQFMTLNLNTSNFTMITQFHFTFKTKA